MPFIHEELKNMRIVAGEFRSRTIDAVAGSATRPTADKIKEAVFSRIGPYFEGGRMLDAYAGSGNISFEALSRGMCESWLCDISAKAVATIRSNASKLGVEERCHIHRRDVFAMLDTFAQADIRFDLVYLDPPYRKQKNAELMLALEEKALLEPSAWVIVESLSEDVFDEAYGSLIKVKENTYGTIRITCYRRTA
ncbi:MAG: 16S rRNA (guanine(966)-N(2))-methyltransferase RsmD [Merdibacter sp.]